ncbi:hydroxymethylglutaryl-CoA reductase, degradative [Nicoliella spurrieriana]|uniref:3-hydroxy-3-methylglutaryl coenzyme A reductase n=1 Tax=Nicoliella spurrieriana TaxID=2925830 RepID=A0A976X603_9LACO|nr:hydroxymethylglutaryl-CoA reductase, degradative [Nicoliella spurrieriana]UQS87077.1 hydroxymethylglutaryl-CoA reductase, degradative [Nicoliella spurrieriana]
MNSPFKHFYRKSYTDRLTVVGKYAELNDDAKKLIQTHVDQTDAHLIENYLTDYSLPEGVGVNLVVNGNEHAIPMVTEEPSVIAAVSNGARMLSKNGITATVINRELIGQVVLHKPSHSLLEWIERHRANLIALADSAHPTISKYGGGATEIELRKLDENEYSLDLSVNVAEAMGANIMNSMLEKVGASINQQAPGVVLMQILSNYATKSLVTVVGKIDFEQLSAPGMTGREVAVRIGLASHVAQIDPYRATTHNKGIMNGVDAITIAMGNDWRAIESGVHAYAARDGQYRGLSRWHIVDHQLVGEMTLPMPVGFVGGATKVFPMVKINQSIARVKNARELMQLIAATGLAQNLAALKAIVTDGIQKGHMALQLNSLAISAGARPDEVASVVRKLRTMKNVGVDDARAIIKQIRKSN